MQISVTLIMITLEQILYSDSRPKKFSLGKLKTLHIFFQNYS